MKIEEVNELWDMLSNDQRIALVKSASREREADLAIAEAEKARLDAETQCKTSLRKDIIKHLHNRSTTPFVVGLSDDATATPVDGFDIIRMPDSPDVPGQVTLLIPVRVNPIPVPTSKTGPRGKYTIQQMGTTRYQDSLVTVPIWDSGPPHDPSAPPNHPDHHFARREVSVTAYVSLSMHRLPPSEIHDKITDNELSLTRQQFDGSDDPKTLEEAPFSTIEARS